MSQQSNRTNYKLQLTLMLMMLKQTKDKQLKLIYMQLEI